MPSALAKLTVTVLSLGEDRVTVTAAVSPSTTTASPMDRVGSCGGGGGGGGGSLVGVTSTVTVVVPVTLPSGVMEVYVNVSWPVKPGLGL